MAKTLRTAAFVVGAAALIATGVGAAAGLAIGGTAVTSTSFGTLIAVQAAAGSIAGIAGAAAAGLSLAAQLSTPKGTVGGNATKFKIDKDAGIPIVFGRTYVGGNVIHRQYYGSGNAYESWVTALSLGPVKSVGPLLIDKVAVTFAGGAATGNFAGFMWLQTQIGACPEPAALAGPVGAIPGWGASAKLSGLAADLWTLKFDKKGKKWPNGVPARGRVVEGVFAWDPRLDATYPGGAGSCRIDDPTTYPWTENPWLLALQFARGFVQNNVLVAGGGLKVTGIDVAAFVEAANCADANGWKAGGQIYTTSDNGWDVMKMLAQAGGGEVFPSAALLSCSFSAPRVSIGTITSDDVAGDLDVPATASMRGRRNTIIPRIRLEAQGWEEVPLDPVSVPAYVALDKAARPKEIAYPLVQQANQAAQLALYDMLNGRELDPIVVPAKIYALGYRPGDCLTLDIPEANLIRRDVIVRNRELDPGSMVVTLSCRSETAGKHGFALGGTGTPPRTPDLTVPSPDDFQQVDAPASTLALLIQNSSNADVAIASADAGGTASITISGHNRVYADRTVALTGATLTGLTNATSYYLAYDDADRAGGAVTYLATTVYADAFLSVDHPSRHFVGAISTAIAGGGATGGGGSTPPGSGGRRPNEVEP